MRHAPAMLTLVVVLSTLISVPQRDLFIGDETKYARVVRGVIEDPPGLVPALDGRPFTHKPPLHFWSMAGLVRIFGFDSLWGFILPSLISLALLILLAVRLGRGFFDRTAGPWAGLVLASMCMVWGLAQSARMDLVFTLLITLGAARLYRFFHSGGLSNAAIAGVWIGIAVLFKGPMAIVIVATLWGLERVRRGASARGGFLIFLLPAIAIPLLWLIPAILSAGPQFAQELLVKQNLGRAVSAWTHREPPWFYLLHYPATFFPWPVVGAVALAGAWRRRKGAPESEAVGFCLSWFLAVLIPFSLISGKLDVYMVPAMVPFALLVGWFVTREGSDARFDLFAARGNSIVAALGMLIGVAILFLTPRLVYLTPETLLLVRMDVRGLFITMIVFSAIAFALSMMPRERLRRGMLGLTIGTMGPLLYVVLFLMPVVNELASAEPLIRALHRRNVGVEDMALYFCPHLWSRDLPLGLDRARSIGRDGLEQAGDALPSLIATQSRRASDLGPRLGAEYVRVETVRVMGRDFDLFERR